MSSSMHNNETKLTDHKGSLLYSRTFDKNGREVLPGDIVSFRGPNNEGLEGEYEVSVMNGSLGCRITGLSGEFFTKLKHWSFTTWERNGIPENFIEVVKGHVEQ